MQKKAVLLINLGTPAHCDTKSVRRYLKEFLLDPRVIDLQALWRNVLVRFCILPFRTKKTTAAYQKIWQADGSPLLSHSQALQRALSQALGDTYEVKLAMRYGDPSIAAALSCLKAVDALTIIPLYPQYSSAATGSSIEKSFEELAQKWNIPTVHLIHAFYQHPGFIRAYLDVINRGMEGKKIDVLVFSYHGLPERHIDKSACHADCDRLHACPLVDDKNAYCYRAHCYATTRLLVAGLHLNEKQYRVSFQSRLGQTPWIKPYTDHLLPELRQQGIKNIAMVCPSFVADCLETLEEVNIRTRALWQALGGEDFTFIPCLNDSSLWVQALTSMIKEQY